jgi:asparagine synthase (glutamine-hydrolysing)
MSYVDITTWLADDLLVKADRMTMANSLELRVPLLDHVLVEFASRLPQSMKIRGADFKYILKRWARPHLPATILERPKKGFPVPTRSWFRGDLAGFARETLLASNGIARTLLEAKEIERVFEAHRFEDRSTQIYSLLVLDAWQRQVLATRGAPRAPAGVVV